MSEQDAFTLPADAQSFYSVSVVVDGALDAEQDIPSDALDAYAEMVGRDAADGKETALYALHHDHPQMTQEEADTGAEDLCAQYATDHHPYRTWNVEQDA